MFSRDWRSYAALAGGVIAVALLAALLWVYVTGGDLVRCGEPDKQPSYATAKPNNLPQSSANGQTRVLSQSVYEQVNCEKPGSDRQYELCQQWHTAKATKEATCIARRQWFLSVVGAVLSLCGLAGLLATVIFAASTAEATSTAAHAADRSAKSAEDALRGLERPYLIIQKIDTTKLFPAETHRRPAIDFTIVNYGKTPGILRTLAVRLQANPDWPLRLPLAHRKEYTTVVEPNKRLTHRGGDDYGTVEVEGSQPGQAFVGVQMASLVFQGAIHYEDPTGAYHVERFCLRGNRDGKSWTIEGAGKYNWRKTTYPTQQRDETDT
jgi:hypothetical protein